MAGTPDHKDFWDKLQIILAPVGGLLTAVAVASLGFIGSRALEQQQNTEAKLRLYSEPMSKREESEATLRKEMFQSIIGSFFDAQSTSLEDVSLSLDGIARRFRMTLLQADTAERKLRVGLEIETPAQAAVAEAAAGRYEVEFEVGFFSTPMIDNTRLSNDQRVALVLTDMNSAGANLSLVLFPGSRASLREKPYYEEILRKLADSTD
jgi:hypothetical protein